MSKPSKSCKYTGHMHIMNRINKNKIDYQSGQSSTGTFDQPDLEKHPKHKQSYPEEQNKCTCKK